MIVERAELERICEEALAPLQFELVAVEFKRETAGWVLRVFIERADGQGGVTLEDCTLASRDLSAAFDVADVIPTHYSLEVSSPGLDRPLVKERDFARFAGHQAVVRIKEPIEGRRNFTGMLRGAGEGRVCIECEGKLFELPLGEVQKANLKPDFEGHGR